MRKEQMVGTRLPQQIVRDLEFIEEHEQADRSSTVRKLLHRAIQTWKLESYADRYGEGRITLARAARDAGVSIWEMTDYTRHHKIAAQYDLDDLQNDIDAITKRRSRA